MPEQTTQERILSYIVDYVEQYELSPTIREIKEAVGLRSTSAVASQINNLVNAGRLRQVGHPDHSPRYLPANAQVVITKVIHG